MCGIGAILSLESRRVPGLESKLALMNDLLKHRGPDGEGLWIHRARARRLGPPAPGDHRPRHRRPADDRPARRLDHLQRRDLQLPRAARRSSGEHEFRTTSRHRGRAARLPAAGAPTCLDASARHVRLRALGRAGAAACSAPATASASSRSTTRSSTACSTSRPRSRRCCRSCRRSRPTSTALQDYLDLPVLPRRQDAVQGRHGAAAGPLR